MSGFGSWNLRGLPESGSHLKPVGILVLFLVTLTIACGSTEPTPAVVSAPLPTVEAEPTLSPPLAIVGEAPTPGLLPAASSSDGAPKGALTGLALPSIADLVEDVTPWVVSITMESTPQGRFSSFANEGAGSGIVIGPEGHVVTNFHVVRGARKIMVHLPDGNSYRARLVGKDEVSDLAVLRINAENLITAKMAADGELRVGDWVLTVGNALALKGGPTVTLGIVSGLARTLQTEEGTLYNLIQTDAAINNGNSGGPLINLKGEVVGINQAILRRAQGVGFAISASAASPIMASLIEHGSVIRPLIGANGQDVTPAMANQYNLDVNEGVMVTSMTRDGPAYEAGIRIGDVILKMDDTPTPDVAGWLNLLWSYGVGDEVDVTYLHENEKLVATVKLTERPS